MALADRWIKLYCPSGNVLGELNPALGKLRIKCRRCRTHPDEQVYHYVDLESAAILTERHEDRDAFLHDERHRARPAFTSA